MINTLLGAMLFAIWTVCLFALGVYFGAMLVQLGGETP